MAWLIAPSASARARTTRWPGGASRRAAVGSRRSSSDWRNSVMRWWKRYHSRRSSSGMTSRFWWRIRSIRFAEPERSKHVVAKAAGDAVEARRIEQEGGDVGIEVLEQLLAEVVDEEAMIAGEVAEELGHRAATGAVGQRREVQGDGPSLGPPDELCYLVGRCVDAERRRTGSRPRARRTPGRPGRPRRDGAARASGPVAEGSRGARRERGASRAAAR